MNHSEIDLERFALSLETPLNLMCQSETREFPLRRRRGLSLYLRFIYLPDKLSKRRREKSARAHWITTQLVTSWFLTPQPKFHPSANSLTKPKMIWFDNFRELRYSTALVLKRTFEISFSLNHHLSRDSLSFTVADLVKNWLAYHHFSTLEFSFQFPANSLIVLCL